MGKLTINNNGGAGISNSKLIRAEVFPLSSKMVEKTQGLTNRMYQL